MCGDIYIAISEDTPEVILNSHQQVFSIRGQSMPEDSHSFYRPIIKWLVEYVQQPFDSMCLDIKLLYFNTTSAKEIARILYALDNCAQRDKIIVRWYYDLRDPENIDICKRYEMIPLRYEYYEYDFSDIEIPTEAEGTYHVIPVIEEKRERGEE